MNGKFQSQNTKSAAVSVFLVVALGAAMQLWGAVPQTRRTVIDAGAKIGSAYCRSEEWLAQAHRSAAFLRRLIAGREQVSNPDSAHAN